MESGVIDFAEALGEERRTITKVAAQVKRSDRVSVFVEGKFAFGITDEVAWRHGLRPGIEVDKAALRTVAEDEDRTRLKRIAIRYISYRMRSETEVRRRLAKEGAAADTISNVLGQLRDLELVDDAAFANAFARDAVARKRGPQRIAQGLRKAGVDPEHIEDALRRIRHVVEDQDLVREVAAKRWRQLSTVEDLRKRRKRLYDHLVRRGFDFEDIRRVMDDLFG